MFRHSGGDTIILYWIIIFNFCALTRILTNQNSDHNLSLVDVAQCVTFYVTSIIVCRMSHNTNFTIYRIAISANSSSCAWSKTWFEDLRRKCFRFLDITLFTDFILLQSYEFRELFISLKPNSYLGVQTIIYGTWYLCMTLWSVHSTIKLLAQSNVDEIFRWKNDID